MNDSFVEHCSIEWAARQAVGLLQGPVVKALPLPQHLQGALVRIGDRNFHIPVIHLQGDREQSACEMIEHGDRIQGFHESILPTPPSQATDR